MSVAITAGVGTPIATELDAAGAQQQRITMGGQLNPVLTYIAISAGGGSGDNTIVAAVAAKRILVYKFFLNAAGAVDIKWKNGAAADFHLPVYLLGKGSSWMLPYDSEPWFVTTAGNALILNLTAAVAVNGSLYYIQTT